jgi:hypothetical protein
MGHAWDYAKHPELASERFEFSDIMSRILRARDEIWQSAEFRRIQI